MGRKKLVRKSEPSSKRRLRWPGWTGFRGMTVRDWLGLLIVPLALVLIGFLFTMQQDARQQRIEDQRARQAQEIENQRAEAERELAEQRAQDEALQAYLDQMSTLMLEKDLRNSKEDSEVRTLARARTLTVLRRLDSSRKAEVIQFLWESDLVNRGGESKPVIELDGADLIGVHLSHADLSHANLSGADLSGAFLDDAFLTDANLTDADLSGADLGRAFLSIADLIGANLRGTDLNKAYLSGADLIAANLSDANLSHANLSGADLSGAFLDDADLSRANLNGANGVAKDQLEQAKSLEGATMPNGQKYEDWLKSKGQEENKKGDGSS